MRKKTKERCSLLLAILLTVSILAGCGGTTDEGASEGAASENGAVASETTESGGKHLIFGQTQTFSSLDPAITYDSWILIRAGVAETLTRLNDSMEAEGWLVEDDYSVAEDGLTWTFTIKDGITFSNGNPLTAEAAAASIQRTLDEALRAPDFFSADEVSGSGQTLTIKTSAPCPTLPGFLSDPLWVIIDTSEDLSDIAEAGPTCTGPFVIDDCNLTTMEINLSKNPNYWDGDVNIDTVQFLQFQDTTTLGLAMQTGELDVAYGVSPTDVSGFESTDGFIVEKCNGARTDWGFMNQSEGRLLSDKELRIALLECLDMETVCEVQLSGAFAAGTTPVAASGFGVGELAAPYTYDRTTRRRGWTRPATRIRTEMGRLRARTERRWSLISILTLPERSSRQSRKPCSFRPPIWGSRSTSISWTTCTIP